MSVFDVLKGQCNKKNCDKGRFHNDSCTLCNVLFYYQSLPCNNIFLFHCFDFKILFCPYWLLTSLFCIRRVCKHHRKYREQLQHGDRGGRGPCWHPLQKHWHLPWLQGDHGTTGLRFDHHGFSYILLRENSSHVIKTNLTKLGTVYAKICMQLGLN